MYNLWQGLCNFNTLFQKGPVIGCFLFLADKSKIPPNSCASAKIIYCTQYVKCSRYRSLNKLKSLFSLETCCLYFETSLHILWSFIPHNNISISGGFVTMPFGQHIPLYRSCECVTPLSPGGINLRSSSGIHSLLSSIYSISHLLS